MTGLKWEPKGEEQRDLIASLSQNPLTICRSKLFGGGKTFCTIGYASEQLYEDVIDKVIFCVDTTVVSEKLGYLPGNKCSKIYPAVKFADSYFKTFLGKEYHKLQKRIEYKDVGELGGSTYTNCFMILDEAANCSRQDVEMFISRAGKHTRCAILGTDRQATSQASFFNRMYNRLSRLDNVGTISLNQVFRNNWMAEVLNALD